MIDKNSFQFDKMTRIKSLPKKSALYRAIQASGGTQVSLAKKVGVSKQAVNVWVRKGRIPDRLEIAKRISDATGIPVIELCELK